MKKTLKIFMMLVVVLATSFAVAAKTTTAKAVFTVEPKMVCTNCEDKIQTNLRFEKGVSEVEASAEKQTVTITYNPNKTNVDNLISAFKKIGYTATQSTATKACAKQNTCTATHSGCGKSGGCCQAKKGGTCCKAKSDTAKTKK